MNFNVIDIGCRSICIELDNDFSYETRSPVRVSLNGKILGDFIKNVFTLKDLSPDTEYEIEIAASCDNSDREVEAVKTVTTKKESVLLEVKDFGAAGDGVTNDTAYLQAAISACPINGTVHIGKGIYLTGPLFLKSDINIWIDRGAVIKGHTDRSLYPILPGMTLGTDENEEYNLGSWEGNPLSSFASLITGIGVENVRIFGSGIIDGNAENGDWWEKPKEKRGAYRPRLVFLNGCRNITVVGIELRNSPSWTVHPYYSDDIKLIEVYIKNPDNSPNTDGIDPESCKNVLIAGANISVGDDCIAIKSGKYYMALKHYKRTENIDIRNCLLNRGHGSVTVGSECAGGVRNVTVAKCIFDSTDRGLRIKTRRGRGKRSIIEGIRFENISMEDVRMPFTINMFYFCDPDGHSDYCQSKEALEITDMTPEIKDISAKNIKCTGTEVCLLTVYGLPESKVGTVTLEDIEADYKEETKREAEYPVMMDGIDKMSGRGIFARNVGKLILKNVHIKGSVDSKEDLNGVEQIEKDNLIFG